MAGISRAGERSGPATPPGRWRRRAVALAIPALAMVALLVTPAAAAATPSVGTIAPPPFGPIAPPPFGSVSQTPIGRAAQAATERFSQTPVGRAAQSATGSLAQMATAPGTNRTVLTPQPNRNRVTNVYRPLTAGPDAPLVVLLTGKSSTGAEMRKLQMDTVADENGFMTAYPEPLSKLWNAGDYCCRTASMPFVDDVKFLSDMVAQLVVEDGVDPRRIYAVGYSAGSVLAYKWGCERQDVLAGIGPDAGAQLNPCSNPAALNLVAVHGTADQTFPLNGGTASNGKPLPSVDQSMSYFKTSAGCPTNPASSEVRGRMTITTWACSNGLGVVRSIVRNEKHTWPGSLGGTVYPTQSVDTSRFFWEQFQRFAPRP